MTSNSSSTSVGCVLAPLPDESVLCFERSLETDEAHDESDACELSIAA
jgi:hypothetical protein